jgi:seryl-tRNA synthetase
MPLSSPLTDRLAATGPAAGVALSQDAEQHALALLRVAINQRFPTDASLWAPPTISMATVERTGYRELFPQLLGTVVSEAARLGIARGADAATPDLALTPAACHHVYPLLDGVAIEAPISIGIEAHCFRNEDTAERGRLRSFTMREIVHVDEPEACARWRTEALGISRQWLESLGVSVAVVIAHDAFFGRGGKLLAASQRELELKSEIQADLGEGGAQAVASVNYHEDHFSKVFGFTAADGAVVHSTCMAFGLERLALAIAHVHGPDPSGWPV